MSTTPLVILASHHSAAQAGELLAASGHDVEFIGVGPDGVDGDVTRANAAFFSLDLARSGMDQFLAALDAAPDLRWLHSCSSGIDQPWFQKLLGRGASITRSLGASSIPIAQTALHYILALSRRSRVWEDNQRRHVWQPHEVADLRELRVTVVGMGAIGNEAARMAAATGMQVTGVRRRPTGEESCPTVTIDQLDDLLPQTDYLLLALPHGPETRHLIDKRRLGLLPPTAHLVNVARGELIDEDALIDALSQGRLAGAALDAFEVEPLPTTSPLWDLPNVIVTPHASGRNSGNDRRALEMFVDNVRLRLDGKPMNNEVVGTLP